MRPSKPEQERVMNSIKHTAAPGLYNIVGTLPVESESRLTYRITSAIEMFEAHCGVERLTRAERVISLRAYSRLNDHAN